METLPAASSERFRSAKNTLEAFGTAASGCPKRLVDIVVVYKVDRLTDPSPTSPSFSELFDDQGTSFVSVTQQFNTSTSMDRLTLNVLLSFAQFEREVAGERIRDKIALSSAGACGWEGCRRSVTMALTTSWW